MSGQDNREIRELVYKYQSALKANFFSEVYVNAIGTEINQDQVKLELKERIDKALLVLHELKEETEQMSNGRNEDPNNQGQSS